MFTDSRIRSVNWHITPRCNYPCKFYFDEHVPGRPVSRHEGIVILQKLADVGMDKINFAGGEPFLHPHLLDYCKESKRLGMTVSITTNGSLITGKKIRELRDYLDCICLSIDSCLDTKEKKLGHGTGNHVTNCLEIAAKIEEAGINLKIITTINSYTYQENMYPLIHTLNPECWDVFRIKFLKSNNCACYSNIGLTNDQFRLFINRHKDIVLKNGNSPMFYNHIDMKYNSWLVLTPNGYVKHNIGRKKAIHSSSSSIEFPFGQYYILK